LSLTSPARPTHALQDRVGTPLPAAPRSEARRSSDRRVTESIVVLPRGRLDESFPSSPSSSSPEENSLRHHRASFRDRAVQKRDAQSARPVQEGVMSIVNQHPRSVAPVTFREINVYRP
jgi:hypothetical protein